MKKNSLSKKQIRLSVLAGIILVSTILIFLKIDFFNMKASGEPPIGTTQVSNITDNRASYPDSKIPKYEKFELTFDINRLAEVGGTVDHSLNEEISAGTLNPYWPYDEDPIANTPEHPNAVPSGNGITVDGLFLKPDGDWLNPNDVITQPGFIFQDFQRQKINDKDWLYPQNNLVWKIRFAPTTSNEWRYKIRITDKTGVTYSDPGSFTAVASSNKGFVKVSSTDSRYFETTESNEYLNITGLNYDENVDILSKADTNFPKLKAGGINLVRNWWQGSQTPIVWGIGGQSGIAGGDGGWDCIEQTSCSNAYLSALASRNGELLSGKFALDNASETINKSASTNTSVIPGRTYKFSAYVKTINVDNADGNSKFYIAANTGGTDTLINWVTFNEDHDWMELTGSYTIPADRNNVDIKLGVTNMKLKDGALFSSHGAWFTDVSVKEDLGNGQYGPEMISIPNFGLHQYVNQRAAWKADYITNLAKQNDIYLDIVLEETVDPIFQRIQADGSAGVASSNNIYADNTSANRVYQQYYWRYFMARYNYSTAIHSLELFNEGIADPIHANALEAFAGYMKNTLKSNHLTTSSLSRDFRSRDFWSYAPDISYATWHNYVSEPISGGHHLGWPINLDAAGFLDKSYYSSAPNSFKISTDSIVQSAVIKNMVKLPITSGDEYKLTWKIASKNMQTSPECKAYATMGFVESSDGGDVGPWNQGASASPSTVDLNSNLDWTEKELVQRASPDGSNEAKYVGIDLVSDKCWGNIYFDDLKLVDQTTGKTANLPNGNFDENSMIDDSALITYGIGSQVGDIFKSSVRSTKVPVILGETGISDPATSTDNYNPLLDNDTNGIWYKKFIWGEINPYGITGLYYSSPLTYNRNPNFLRYSKAYQSFMSGIHLSNGKYSDAEASSSNSNLRVWGQKEIVDGKAANAHLWIDNKPYTWKSIVDGNTPPPISGTVIVPNMANHKYMVEWWDTSSGTITKKEVQEVVNNNLVLTVSNLPSDIAVKTYQTDISAPNISFQTPNITSTLDTTIEVRYTVDNVAKTKTFDLEVGDNYLEVSENNPSADNLTTTSSLKVIRKPAYTLQSSNFSNFWNMVSLPYLNSLISKDLPTGFRIRKYNPSTNSYEKLEGKDIPLTSATGYWINMDDPSKINNFKYESQSITAKEVSVLKGWAMLGNPFDSNLPLSNLQVKYKDGSTRSYQDAIQRKDVSGYAWSYEASEKQYHFIAITPEKYKTSLPKQTYISPFRGFWVIIKSDQVDAFVMDK